LIELASRQHRHLNLRYLAFTAAAHCIFELVEYVLVALLNSALASAKVAKVIA